MQSLLQKVSFYLCLHPMNNENRMIPSAAVNCINEFTQRATLILLFFGNTFRLYE